MITSCSKDEDELVFQMVEDTRPVPTRYDKLSTTEFKNLLIGYGWKEAETHIINTDGTIDKKDYWEDMCGGGPSTYEFTDTRIIDYFFADAIPARVSVPYTYTYDEATNSVYYANGYFWFSIVRASLSEVTIIKRAGVKADRDSNKLRPVYHYVILKRLSASELEQVRNSHTPYDQVKKYY
jgi:hypothetical protein